MGVRRTHSLTQPRTAGPYRQQQPIPTAQLPFARSYRLGGGFSCELACVSCQAPPTQLLFGREAART